MYGVPLRTKYGNKLNLKKFKKHHDRNTKNYHSKVKCNRSYFKLPVSKTSRNGHRDLENESSKFVKNNVLKFRVLKTPVK